MNILQMLKEEHKEVAHILEQLDDTTDRAIKTREATFAKLYKALSLHADFEEQFFYPQVKESKEVKDIVLEAYEEHHVVKTLLSELNELAVNDETWHAKLKVLKENVTHHVKEEEDELFPKVKQLVEPTLLEDLAEKYTHFKANSKIA